MILFDEEEDGQEEPGSPRQIQTSLRSAARHERWVNRKKARYYETQAVRRSPILGAAWKVRFMLRATATVPWPFTAA